MERNDSSDTLTNESNAIIRAIQEGGRERELALKGLYENSAIYRSIAKTVREYGGHDPDIKDIFQETIIRFDRMVRDGKFKKESSIETFIIAVGRNICRNWNRTGNRVDQVTTDDVWPGIANTYAAEEKEERAFDHELLKILDDILNQLKPICKTILRMWQLSYSMQQISDHLELGSRANARKRKFRCLKLLIDKIEENPGTQNYLKEVWKTEI